MMITLTTQCSNRPARGALKGLLLAQKDENGKMPSRPSSCTSLPWEKMTLSTLPNADKATKTDSARSAFPPKTFRKYDAAKMRPEERISSLGTAAK